MRQNILVAYQGGCYEGCFWEWNYFMFDSKGTFHNLFTSGRDGIKTEAEALELVEMLQNPSTLTRRTEASIFDLTNEDDMNNFQDGYNAGHVVAVVDKVNKVYRFNKEQEPMFFVCDYCKAKTAWGESDGPEGCGGIAIQNTIKICDDCHDSYSCSYCGELCPVTEKFDDDGRCKSCCEREQVVEDKLLAEEAEMAAVIGTLTELSEKYYSRRSK